MSSILTSNPSPSPYGDSKIDFVMLKDDPNDVELFNRDSMFYDRATWSQMIATKRLEYRLQIERYSRFVVGVALALLVIGLVCMAGGLWKARGTWDEDQANFMLQANAWRDEVGREDDQCSRVPPVARFDCNPDPPISQDVCLARGCCWSPKTDNETIPDKGLPPVGVPYCHFGSDHQGYQVSSHEDHGHTQIYMLKRTNPSGFRGDVPLVRLTIQALNSRLMRIKLVDANKERYEVPIPKLNLPPPFEASGEPKPNLTVVFDTNTSMLKIFRKIDGEDQEEVFGTFLSNLIYSDQFLQMSTNLYSPYLYGLGEHMSSFQKLAYWQRYTQLARDQYPKPGEALYGAHNLFLSQSSHLNSTYGIFLFNSNAMDIITQPSPSLTWRTIGGVLDFFIFLGPKPEDVVQQYTTLIGRPAMPPYWALGFHLSRYGYKTLDNLKAVYERTKRAGIPYDVQWTDIDMFEENNDFTYDHARFAGLPEFIEKQLHGEGRRFVPMFDCGISAGEGARNYAPFDEGLAMNVFVRNASNGVLVGKVWNTKSTVWPDFFHPNATAWWTRQFARYHESIAFDGAWIDMNEPSNFYDGSEVGCPRGDSLEEPQYTPGMDTQDKTLKKHTICMTAKHAVGRHYDLHNLYGFSEAIVTNRALSIVLPNRRPLIISRSTAPGHGAVASHWTGDVVSDWASMRASISSVLNFNLFGIPLVGADICGFNDNTTEELCARWHQLGAFYSFARNHNTDDAIEQDPVALGPRVVSAARNALLVRYRHLPYLYTLFWRAHTDGGTVLRPLLFEFPNDRIAAGLSTQFMWGSGLMIAPVLEEKADLVNVYFPSGFWYRLLDFGAINATQAHFKREEASFDHPNVYYRAGQIIPVHREARTTTDEMKKGDFELIVASDPVTGKASGQLYWDRGDGLDTNQLGLYNLYRFELSDWTNLSICSIHLGFETSQYFGQITVLGVDRLPEHVMIDGQFAKSSYSMSNRTLFISAGDRLPLFASSNQSMQHHIQWFYSS